MNTVTCPPVEAFAHAQLYHRLNYKSDQARMLTFLPGTSTGDVHCQMQTVSWKDRTTGYNDFVSASSSRNRNQRQNLLAWIETSEGQPSGPVPRLTPDAHQYRFNWGDYATLSYVWGDGPATETIIINGIKVKVRPNLASALRALALDHRFKDRFHVWVDALCIHQCDVDERADQVSRMKHVYSMSWNVISWLGVEAENSGRAFPLLRNLAGAHRDAAVAQQLRVKFTKNRSEYEDGSWLAIHELIRRPYWRRMWIVQELALGNTAVTVRCGEEQMDWQTFIDGIEALHFKFWETKDKFILDDIYRFHGRRDRSIDVFNQHLLCKGTRPLINSQMRKTGPKHAPLTTLLETAAHCRASEPKDKVYGLLAMMDPNLSRGIQVDYSLNIAAGEVFANVARAAFACYGNLELLRECNACPPQGGPTWAPDWTWQHRERDARLRQGYRANAERLGAFEVDDAGRILTCEVVFAGVIDGIGARRTGRYTYLENSIVQPTSSVSAYGGPEDTKKAFVHALAGDISWRHRNDTDERKSILYLPTAFNQDYFRKREWLRAAESGSYYHAWTKWRRSNRELQVASRRLDDYFETKVPESVVENPSLNAKNKWTNMMLGRRFATTENGLFGWVPDLLGQPPEKQVNQGDLVAIVLGCTIPIILRRSSAEQLYQVVGEAYFLGLMDGEAIDDSVKVSTIHIK